MITTEDIENFGMFGEGKIFRYFELRFTVGDILYECIRAGKRKMCVGYGIGTEDTCVVIVDIYVNLITSPQNLSQEQQKAIVYNIAIQAANKAHEVTMKTSDFEIRDYVLTEIETAAKMAAECKAQDDGGYSHGVAMGRLYAASDMAVILGISGDEIGKIRTRYID